MTAVAVFDHHPSADTMLQARLARGWRPTPSQLKAGEQVLGYAACAIAGPHRAEEASEG